jgi:hypothetical protein
MRAGMVVSGWLVLALAGCEYDSTSAGELVIAPEEPLCHPWPSCTSWTSDSALMFATPVPIKQNEGVKTGHSVLADFELSVTGESVPVRLKAGTRYRLEYEGPEESIIVRAPGRHGTGLPTVGVGHLASASGERVLEFTTGPGGTYEFVAGRILDGSVRVRLSRF